MGNTERYEEMHEKTTHTELNSLLEQVVEEGQSRTSSDASSLRRLFPAGFAFRKRLLPLKQNLNLKLYSQNSHHLRFILTISPRVVSFLM